LRNSIHVGMEDRFFTVYKQKVYEKLSEIDRSILPHTWWDSIIKHYYTLGYSEERTVRTILETMKK
jgi:hypothetical protein